MRWIEVAAPTTPVPTFAEPFTPKLVTVLREGCGLRRSKADTAAGFAVAIVALPSSMAVASRLTPDGACTRRRRFDAELAPAHALVIRAVPSAGTGLVP